MKIETVKLAFTPRADLDRVPEISVGDEVSDEIGDVGKSESNSKDDEKFWRKSAADFRKELSNCASAEYPLSFPAGKLSKKQDGSIYGGAKSPFWFEYAFQEPAECERLRAIESQLEDAEWRWEEFTERARKAEIPWSWMSATRGFAVVEFPAQQKNLILLRSLRWFRQAAKKLTAAWVPGPTLQELFPKQLNCFAQMDEWNSPG